MSDDPGVDTHDFQPSISLHITQAEEGGTVVRPSLFSWLRQNVVKEVLRCLRREGTERKRSKSNTSLAKEWALQKIEV